MNYLLIGEFIVLLFAAIGIVISGYAIYDFFAENDEPEFRDYSHVDYF